MLIVGTGQCQSMLPRCRFLPTFYGDSSSMISIGAWDCWRHDDFLAALTGDCLQWPRNRASGLVVSFETFGE